MNKIFLSLAILLTGLTGFSQETKETIIWGAEVIDVSSEYTPYEYSAVQSLHRPNVYPESGDSPNAWRPKKPDSEEFIMVSFATPVKAQQIAIAETENPGAVKRILVYDEQYNEYQIIPDITPRDLPIENRLLNLYFPETNYEIQAVKVIIDGSIDEGFNAIDAIGVSSSNVPISVLINVLPKVNTEMEADKLNENVNSTYTEHSPIISPDGKRLYFSRQFHPDNVGGDKDSEDIWVSELDEETGEWLPAKNIGPPLNTNGPNFISSINVVDGKEVLVLGNRYGKKGRMYTGVSMSTFENGTFSEPTALEIEDEYNYSPNADFFLVPGGSAIIMSAERDDTFGNRDLYITFKKRNGTWSKPTNLGPDINSIGEEMSPFLANDGKTLYFSSDGYNGYGGQDIYVSFRLEENSWTKWSSPENLGSGVNGEGDDEYLSVPSSGTQLYYTRSEDGENTDIYTFKMEDLFVEDVDNTPLASSLGHLEDTTDVEEPVATVVEPVEKPKKEVVITVTGIVTNSKTNKPVENTNIQIERLPDGLEVGNVTTDKSGKFSFTVRNGARYAMIAEAEGFISQGENFDFNETKVSDTIERNLKITPIEKGETIVLNNIFFDFDKSKLKTSSYPELNRVLKFMKDEKIKKIALYGHTDSIGNDEYNMGLSGRRAKSVMDFLLNNGIAEDRVSYQAFGETKPVATNDTLEGRAKNRRVEFEIIE